MSVPTPPQVNPLPRVGSTTIEVWWDPPLSDGGNPILDYTLSCISPALTFTIPAPQNYYLVTGLTTGVNYAFTITANNTNGSSDPAAFRQVICGTFPAPPENVSTVYTSLSSGTAKVTWDVPLSDGGATLKYYAVEASPQYPDYVSTVSFGTPASQLQRWCDGLTPNQNYSFAVNSINDPGWSLLPSTTNYALYSPLNTPNLFLWFDGADPTSYTTDPITNCITTWVSKTLPQFSTSSATTQRGPFLSNTEFGAFPSMYFNPSNLFSQYTTLYSSDIPALTCNGPFATFTVVRQVNYSAPYGIWSTNFPDYPNGINLFSQTDGSFALAVSTIVIPIIPSTLNTNVIVTCLYETTEISGALNFGMTFNGNDILTSNFGSAPTVSGLVLGNFDQLFNGGFFFPDNGFITEHIVVQNDPSQATRQELEGYLAWKYNMASELPPTHPYYASPPTA
jgi:hypothetical protein